MSRKSPTKRSAGSLPARIEPTVLFPGQPPKYRKAEELAKVFADYFASIGDEPPTVTGLALHAGFASRQSLYDMAERKQFSYIIDRARLLIEHYHERLVFLTENPEYSINWLRQHGDWIDPEEGGQGAAGAHGGTLQIEVVAVAAAATATEKNSG